MKNLLSLCALCLYAMCASAGQSAQVPVPSAATLNSLEKGVIAIVHFGLNTFADREWGYGDTPPSVFAPAKLDARQWVEAAKAGGIRRIVLVCKHHDGFCLWPSRYNKDYTVANSPWKGGRGDLVKEVRDATLAAGLEFGAYLSPWDRHHAEYARPAYVEYFHRQWAELMADYGPISEIWLDGANGGDGWYGGAREHRKIPAAPVYYDHPRLLKALEAKYPLASIFGMDTDRTLRWPGNERGTVPEDYDLVRNGVFQPPEADTPMRSRWFWHRNDKAKSLKNLTDRYLESVGRSGILDLGLAPNTDGLLDEGDVIRLKEFGDWVRAFNSVNLAKGIKPERSGKRWIWTLPDERTFDAIDIREDIRKGLRVKSWRAYADGREIAHGSQIGFRRIARTGTVAARKIEIEVKSEGEVALHLSLRRIPPQEGFAASAPEKEPAAAARATIRPASVSEEGAVLSVDFGGRAELGGFSFVPGEAAPQESLPKGWRISVSEDGQTWRDAGGGEFGNIRANPILQEVRFAKPVAAARLRLEAVPFGDGGEPRWLAAGGKVEFSAP